MYAFAQALGQHVLFCIRSDSACLCVPNELPYRPWLATFQLILISLFLGSLFFGTQVFSASATSMRILPSGAYGLSTMLASTIAPWSIRLIPCFLNCLFSPPRSLSIIPKRVSSARKRQMVLWSGAGSPDIQEEEFAEEEGVVDPFFDFVITLGRTRSEVVGS